MKTAAPMGKTAPGTAPAGGRGGSVDKPTGKVRKPMTPGQQKQLAVVLISAVIVAAVGYSIYAFFNRPKGDGAPRLNEPPVTIARFIGTTAFDQLPYDRQRVYMKELGGKKKELEAEFTSGKLSRKEWEDTLAVLWLGKQFKHIDRYYSLGALDKKAYIDELINDDIKDEVEDAAKPKGSPKRDKDKVKKMVERFPETERRAFDGFRTVLKEREKEREKEAKAAAKAAKAAATRPTTRPPPSGATGGGPG
jgi:hypothetical protein